MFVLILLTRQMSTLCRPAWKLVVNSTSFKQTDVSCTCSTSATHSQPAQSSWCSMKHQLPSSLHTNLSPKKSQLAFTKWVMQYPEDLGFELANYFTFAPLTPDNSQEPARNDRAKAAFHFLSCISPLSQFVSVYEKFLWQNAHSEGNQQQLQWPCGRLNDSIRGLE